MRAYVSVCLSLWLWLWLYLSVSVCVCQGGSQDCDGMRELQEALALAIKEERFEDAASLRDAMTSMKARTSGTPLALFKSMCL